MKIVKTYLILIILLVSCSHEAKFTGYIVAKEFHPERMSDDPDKPIAYNAVYVPRPVIVPHTNPAPHKVEARWVWYIANKTGVITHEVSESVFNSKKCGDLVTIER